MAGYKITPRAAVSAGPDPEIPANITPTIIVTMARPPGNGTHQEAHQANKPFGYSTPIQDKTREDKERKCKELELGNIRIEIGGKNLYPQIVFPDKKNRGKTEGSCNRNPENKKNKKNHKKYDHRLHCYPPALSLFQAASITRNITKIPPTGMARV